MLWVIPLGIMGLSGAAAWLLRAKGPTAPSIAAPSQEVTAALRAPSTAAADECATLLEEVARQARRLSLLPASATQELFTWAAHANGANVRALSAGGRARMPSRWRRVKTIQGICMGEPVSIDVYRPDTMGAPLAAPSWVTIGALLSGEGPALAITGSFGPTTLRQLQADDRWLLLADAGAGAAADTRASAPPSTPAARPPAAAAPSRPTARPSGGAPNSLQSVSNAIKNAAQGGPASTITNLVAPTGPIVATDDASRKIAEIADAVRRAKGIPSPPITGPNESRGSLAAVTKSIANVTSTAIQQTEAAKARARAQAAVAAVQKGANS